MDDQLHCNINSNRIKFQIQLKKNEKEEFFGSHSISMKLNFE